MPVFRLSKRLVFPRPELSEEDGLLAVGGDLSPERLVLAYSNGIFPWYDETSPILWWSPDPRLVFHPEAFRVHRRLARTMRSGKFTWTADTDFNGVIRGCAESPRPGQEGTWIIPPMIEAYERLHELGIAHSIECWCGDGLAGGLYGVGIGACFFAESMFSRRTDASKTAMAILAAQCRRLSIRLIDAQMPTSHLLFMGGVVMPRADYLGVVSGLARKPAPKGKWRLDGLELPADAIV